MLHDKIKDMITKEERIAHIEQSQLTGEAKSINYGGNRNPRDVKKIPLEYLLYNPHNGRIRSFTKSFEQQFHRLDPSNKDDKLIIEQYLFDSAKGRNEKTLESLEIKGQQEVGIVTKDGIIIDGNRRALLLNKLHKQGKSDGYFNAIVLEDELADNEPEIVKLETGYQMGVDSKVDYNPIEKYIRCSELLNEYRFSINDIADVMAEEIYTIQEWLDRLQTMDEYLAYWSIPGVYTRLEKREGHFVDLTNYLKTYTKKHPPSVNWNYTNEDLLDLKTSYFTYIRLGIPVLRTRVIATPASGNSFFCYKEIWGEFYKEHKEIITSISEPNFFEIKKNQNELSNEDAIRELDEKWKQVLSEPLLENLSFYEGVLKDRLEIHKPVKILRRINNSIHQIDQTQIVNSDTVECNTLLDKIISRAMTLKGIIS
jgi:hypothetical protein